jgi:hypothetical protein
MEQKIKNFDRGIEQMMNEHEVAPPFGMWNRIAGELEAMPVAAAAPVATSLIPKRAMIGIIATALILGTATLTGYLVNSSTNTNRANTIAPAVNTQIESSVKPASTNPVNQQTIAVKNDVVASNPTTPKAKAHHTTASNPVQATLQVAQQVNPTINQPVVSPVNVIANNANADVPTPIAPIQQNVSEETQTYFFPPIDVNTPEKNKPTTEATVLTIRSHGKVGVVAQADNNDAPSGHKSFHPHHRQGWAYGSIIR